MDIADRTVVLIVPGKHVKTVKTALEHFNKLDRSSKITPEVSDNSSATSDLGTSTSQPQDPTQSSVLKFDLQRGEYVDPSVPAQRAQSGQTSPEQAQNVDPFPILKFDLTTGEYVDPAVIERRDQTKQKDQEPRMRIPTTISHPPEGGETEDLKSRVLEGIGLSHLFDEISLSYQNRPRTTTKNPLHKAMQEALEKISETALAPLDLAVEALVSSLPDSYSVYKPMLLLPPGIMASESWKTLLSAHPVHSDILQSVWKNVAQAVGATHVAINSPIPLQSTTTSQDNILRSPVNLAPVYGDFGPAPSTQTLSAPTASDFENALWVTTTQNCIHQTWAPLYTMFSRGNIREKTRILNLPSVATDYDVASSAVDMYAGIGYFAFSYKKAGAGRVRGIKRVLSWELNPWSVEGLRRGAKMNGWTCKVFKESDMSRMEAEWEAWKRDMQSQEEDFWIFQMSNEVAGPIIERLDAFLPPVRHVNLGLLPSSRPSWSSAVSVIDASRGGWIHVHENVGVDDIDTRASEIETVFQTLLDEKETVLGKRRAKREHVERVKMYAPGVVHCVFDIHVNGTGTQG